MIDLSSLHSRTEEEIVLQEEYELPKDYYQNTDIQELIGLLTAICRTSNQTK